LEWEWEWEEEDNWYSLDQVPTTSHLVKTRPLNTQPLKPQRLKNDIFTNNLQPTTFESHMFKKLSIINQMSRYAKFDIAPQGKTMISQSILLELSEDDKIQLYLYTGTGLTDHKNSRYTHLVGLLLRPSVESLQGISQKPMTI
jgi:hypothetical protein